MGLAGPGPCTSYGQAEMLSPKPTVFTALFFSSVFWVSYHMCGCYKQIRLCLNQALSLSQFSRDWKLLWQALDSSLEKEEKKQCCF